MEKNRSSSISKADTIDKDRTLSIEEKRKLVDELCGSWAGDESLGEIFKEIQEERNRIPRDQLSELQEGMIRLRNDLKIFEEKYQMSSEAFYRQFSAGLCGDDADFIVWAGLYEMLRENEMKLGIGKDHA